MVAYDESSARDSSFAQFFFTFLASGLLLAPSLDCTSRLRPSLAFTGTLRPNLDLAGVLDLDLDLDLDLERHSMGLRDLETVRVLCLNLPELRSKADLLS